MNLLETEGMGDGSLIFGSFFEWWPIVKLFILSIFPVAKFA